MKTSTKILSVFTLCMGLNTISTEAFAANEEHVAAVKDFARLVGVIAESNRIDLTQPLTKENLDSYKANEARTAANEALKTLGALDLSGADLSNLVFVKISLKKANLKGANLAGTRFEGANLIRSNFKDATLNGVKFVRTNLRRTIFNKTALTDAVFDKSPLSRAEFKNLALAGVLISNAKADKLKFKNVSFDGARFHNVQIDLSVIGPNATITTDAAEAAEAEAEVIVEGLDADAEHSAAEGDSTETDDGVLAAAAPIGETAEQTDSIE